MNDKFKNKTWKDIPIRGIQVDPYSKIGEPPFGHDEEDSKINYLGRYLCPVRCPLLQELLLGNPVGNRPSLW